MRPLKVIFPNMDVRLLCTWIIFRPGPRVWDVWIYCSTCAENCSEQNCVHEFCRAECLLPCDSQHLKLYEAQLPLLTSQANKLPNPGSQSGKNPKLECCSVWPLLPCQPGEQITKNPLEKPVIVRSLGSCVLLTALKWIALLLLLLKRGRPGARMDSTYVLIRGTAKWDPSVGLKHGLLLKCISAERATRTFLVVFFFLFMALSWKMKTNFPYFSSLHCFDRLLSLESWNSSVLLYIDVYLPSLVRINNFSNSRGLKAL